MSEHRPSIEDAVGAVAGERSDGVEVHPEARELTAYALGDLEPEAAERVRDHLALCRACAGLVLDLGGFGTAGSPEEAAAVEWEGRRPAAWRRLRARLDADADAATVPSAVPFPAPAPPPATVRAGVPRRWLAAAAVVALLAGAGGWLAGRHGRPGDPPPALPAPALSVPTVDLFPSSYRRGSELPELTVEAPVFVLEMHAEAPDAGRDHRLRIVGADGEVWSGGGLRPTPAGSFRVALPGGWLPPGRYRLEVTAAGSDGGAPVGVYEVVIGPAGEGAE